LKVDVATNLPPKKEYVLFAPLTRQQKDLYEATLEKRVHGYLVKKALDEIEANEVKEEAEEVKEEEEEEEVKEEEDDVEEVKEEAGDDEEEVDEVKKGKGKKGKDAQEPVQRTLRKRTKPAAPAYLLEEDDDAYFEALERGDYNPPEETEEEKIAKKKKAVRADAGEYVLPTNPPLISRRLGSPWCQ
jgi:hypothetical protein